MKRKILKKILKKLTIKILKKYNPYIIAVTGNVGKTSAKEAIYFTISKHKRIKKSSGNLNTEIGAPLVFLGVDTPGNNLKSWLKIIIKGLKLIIFRDKNYPEIIVLEMAADKKGDIEYLTSFIRPNIGIVTAIGDAPVHLQNFGSVNEVVKEKSILIKNLKKGGIAILNSDDGRVFQMKGRTKESIFTYGFSNIAVLKVLEIDYQTSKKSFNGIELLVEYDKQKQKIKLPYILDKGSVYSVLISISVGLVLGIPIYKLIESCSLFKSPKGRMSLLDGIDCKIIDSSYNAAPESTKMALETLKILPAKRKVALLGDMLELGTKSKNEHIRVGEMIDFLDVLVTVGNGGKIIAKTAKNKGLVKKIYSFKDSETASKRIKKIINKDDLILVKGSQGVRMEKIIEKIIKENPKELLIRQENHWKDTLNEDKI